MGRSFKKVPSIKPQKLDCYKKETSIILPKTSLLKNLKKLVEH